METQEITEKKSDVLTREILERYAIINDLIAGLTARLRARRTNRSALLREAANLKPHIISIVGLARTNEKFYAATKDSYRAYVDYKAGGYKEARYGAETTVEIWDIISTAMIEHGVIELTGA